MQAEPAYVTLGDGKLRLPVEAADRLQNAVSSSLYRYSGVERAGDARPIKQIPGKRAGIDIGELRVAAKIERIPSRADRTETRFEQAFVGLGFGEREFEPSCLHEQRQGRVIELNAAQARACGRDTKVHVDPGEIAKLERLLRPAAIGSDGRRDLRDDRIEIELAR